MSSASSNTRSMASQTENQNDSNALFEAICDISLLEFKLRLKDSQLRDKDTIINANKLHIARKDQLIEMLSTRYLDVNTQLAERDGFLNNRGIIDHFKNRYQYSSSYPEISSDLPRYELWRRIINRDDDFRKFILSENLSENLRFTNIEDVASSIVDAYERLSQVSKDFFPQNMLKVADKLLTPQQAAIVSYMCFELHLHFHSQHIDRDTIEHILRDF